jgi:hypothetical protein
MSELTIAVERYRFEHENGDAEWVWLATSPQFPHFEEYADTIHEAVCLMGDSIDCFYERNIEKHRAYSDPKYWAHLKRKNCRNLTYQPPIRYYMVESMLGSYGWDFGYNLDSMVEHIIK